MCVCITSVFLFYRNVKVVAFGKAVLGMVTALEDLIGDHISEGVASIPAGFLDIARKAFPQYLPKKDSKIRCVMPFFREADHLH